MTMADPGSPPFSRVLREATRAEHELAEESPFMRRLVAGEGTGEWYRALAAQLWFVYGALETAAGVLATDRRVSPFLADELNRVPALRADLQAMAGADLAGGQSPFPATRRYADRILDVAHRCPPAYIAHHYTRYLGDLSGGQIMRRRLQQHYGLSDDCLSFFVFSGIPRPKVFKDRYRAHLDDFGARATPDERDLVIAEAREAFHHNRAVFADVAATVERPAA